MVSIDFTQLRFLVVDDNAYMRQIIRTILHGFGTRTVEEAHDGADALERLGSIAPDIVILDWVMPIIDGLEFTRLVRRQDSPSPYVPLIMMTGHSSKRRVTEARDAGITEFLRKPVSAKALHDRIASITLTPRPFIRTKTYFGPDRRRNENPGYKGAERRKADISQS